MQAVILAGGLGTRLKPLTEHIPKVMVSVSGKPFLLYLLELLKNQGIKDVVLCIGYRGEQIKKFFSDGRNAGVKIQYSEEKEGLLGTGGALKKAQNILESHFLIINGDTYLPINYREVDKFFINRGKKALMVVYDNREDTGVKNNVELDDDLMVTRYDKEKSDAGLRHVEAGVLLLKREALNLIEGNYPISLENGLYPALIRVGELAAYVTGQRFYDIGTLQQLKILEERLEKGIVTVFDNRREQIPK